MNESQAIERFLTTGSEESFAALFEAAYPRLRRYFLLRGIEEGEAEDVAQNVMVLVYQHRLEVRAAESFYGWLFKVAKNELARYWRQSRTRQRLAAMEQLTDELAGRLTIEMEWEGGSNFTSWMDSLEPAERELILLRFVEGLSYEELALALEIPLGTVKWRLFAVKKKLIPMIRESSPAKTGKRLH